MNKIGLFNETKKVVKDFDLLEGILEYTLKKENVDNCEFNIILVDNEKIKQINNQYRGKDNITDVISFALEDNKDFLFSDHRVLGDIYISLDKAEKQAEEYGHTFKRELNFLAVHGLLHLLGYDHINKYEEEKMFERQKEILDEYEIKR